MAFNAVFLTFDKKENSTKKPIIEPVTPNLTVLSVVLKEESSIINPILKIYNTANFNPYQLNYCYISKFGRYYFVNDWIYNIGEWECYLQVDALASFKTEIGNMTKYILRSSYEFDLDIVDTFYPAKSERQTHYTDETDFFFDRDFSGGMYVLGVANRDNDGVGAICYYTLTATQMRNIVKYMLIGTSDVWDNMTFTGLTDILYRSIYAPFDYIKSCKWFPISYFPLNTTPIVFGNYVSDINGQYLDVNTENWPSPLRTLDLPSNWTSLEAKYKTKPFADLYIVFNPFGIIELNPIDFADADSISLEIFPDYISGDCMLKIYKNVGSDTYFITEKNANIGVDVNLSAASANVGGMLGGIAGGVGGLIAGASMGGLSGVAAMGLSVAGGVTSAEMSSIPTMSNSLGITIGGARAMEGIATLVYIATKFSDEDNSDFGKPLYKTRTINTISGYIKCAESHCEIAGAMKQEIEMIGDYLTDGFYFE